jgi:cobalt-zinc-cadmium efflux system membrane fusion protein
VKKLLLYLSVCLSITACAKKDPPPAVQKKPMPTCQVKVQKVESFTEATGTVQPDLEGGAKVLSPLAGAVEKIFVRVGDNVRKGAPLASVRSSDVSDTHSGLLANKALLKQAERTYNLNKQLFEIGAVTKNDLLSSEAAYEQAKAVVEGLQRKLDIYGADASDGYRGAFIIRAPISGRVADIQAHLGDRFDTATPLMTLVDPGRIMVVANLFDTDLGKVSKGKEVTFSTDVYPGVTFKGVVSYVSDVEDADSKTIKTYIRPLSGAEKFKQNMFLKISILEGEKQLAVIPKNAMIYKEGKFYVQVKNSTGFELKAIKPVRDISDKQAAVEGVTEGDVIVSAAIDLEQP